MVISGFIVFSTILFIIIGNPVKLLILAGAVNGLILPVALAVILVAAARTSAKTNYRHPLWMYIAGWIVVAVMTYMGAITIKENFGKLF